MTALIDASDDPEIQRCAPCCRGDVRNRLRPDKTVHAQRGLKDKDQRNKDKALPAQGDQQRLCTSAHGLQGIYMAPKKGPDESVIYENLTPSA